MMWGDWGGWGGFLAMSLMMVLFWGGLVWLVAYAIRTTSGRGRGTEARPAIRILEERFARGEIDHDEFEERRRVLDDRGT